MLSVWCWCVTWAMTVCPPLEGLSCSVWVDEVMTECLPVESKNVVFVWLGP